MLFHAYATLPHYSGSFICKHMALHRCTARERLTQIKRRNSNSFTVVDCVETSMKQFAIHFLLFTFETSMCFGFFVNLRTRWRVAERNTRTHPTQVRQLDMLSAWIEYSVHRVRDTCLDNTANHLMIWCTIETTNVGTASIVSLRQLIISSFILIYGYRSTKTTMAMLSQIRRKMNDKWTHCLYNYQYDDVKRA